MTESGELERDPSVGPHEDDLSSPLLLAVHAAYLQVGRSMIERSITRANIVLTSGTAAITAYTALLGLMSSTEHGRRLAPIAFLPVPYLGLTIACTAFYVGYVAPHAKCFHPLPLGPTQEIAEDRLATFLTWVHEASMSRAWALRTALVSLALGLVLLPVGFIALTGTAAVLVETTPGALMLVYAGIEIWRHKSNADSGATTHRPDLGPMVVSPLGPPKIPDADTWL